MISYDLSEFITRTGRVLRGTLSKSRGGWVNMDPLYMGANFVTSIANKLT